MLSSEMGLQIRLIKHLQLFLWQYFADWNIALKLDSQIGGMFIGKRDNNLENNKLNAFQKKCGQNI